MFSEKETLDGFIAVAKALMKGLTASGILFCISLIILIVLDPGQIFRTVVFKLFVATFWFVFASSLVGTILREIRAVKTE
ncbi:hypothetical protein H6781_02805 [Candidatus Nomurabacteria bacterium]|nr:hypothetical protein [Candidatus Nomurabacteria bacterium]